MPDINEMKESKYLGKVDCKSPIVVTFDRCEKQNIAGDDKPAEIKWVATFRENVKPMIMNWTNIQLAAVATGEQNSDNWGGKQVVIFNDPTISFGGKLVGGIRIRAIQSQGTMTQGQSQQYRQASGDVQGHGDNLPPHTDDTPPPPTEDPRDFSEGDPDDSLPF